MNSKHLRIRKGLDIPIAGRPRMEIDTGNEVRSVAALGLDTPGLKPRMAVQQGDRVKTGQVLYVDKRNPDVPFTAPGSGVVSVIHRGERRILHSVVIELGGNDEQAYPVFEPSGIERLSPEEARRILIESGQWTYFRTRPYSRIPQPGDSPSSIFVTAVDTNPLAPDPAVIIAGDAEAFSAGIRVVAKLTDGPTWVCTRAGSDIAVPDAADIRHVEVEGPHPAGLVGTHIHFLDPVHAHKFVWHIGYQDTIAVGRLFLTGRLSMERIVGLGGPMVKDPRLVRTRRGASILDLLDGELKPGKARIVSGSVLAGHRASGTLAWLGRYRNQISALAEGSPREFLSWMRPGRHKYSALRAYASTWIHRGDYEFTTSQNGSPRAMVSTGSFERVMPLDILPTVLLKSLLVRDTQAAQQLGCLELDEEDLALCSFVCNGKYDYGPHLRKALEEIEVNG
jgi:Na+-transporting NADH:ubiquinone oxidoreductase subunit A